MSSKKKKNQNICSPEVLTQSMHTLRRLTGHTLTHTHLPRPWYSAVQGAPDGRRAVALPCCACSPPHLSAEPGVCRAEQSWQVLTEFHLKGVLSPANAAAPQLLAVLLNQRRRHKVKGKEPGRVLQYLVCVCVKKWCWCGGVI